MKKRPGRLTCTLVGLLLAALVLPAAAKPPTGADLARIQRQFAQKDATIADLRRQLAAAQDLITRLRQRMNETTFQQGMSGTMVHHLKRRNKQT